MSSEWQTLKLGELGQIVTGKTPKTSDPNNFGGEIPFVTPTDMDGRKVISVTARYLTEIGVSTVKNSFIPAGSVMVSCIGSDMGKSVIAGRNCVTNQQINSIIVGDKFNSDFVYYNLSMRKAELQHLASGGSTMPILNKSQFSEISINLPPLADQVKIAAFLGTLDDRIILLRETNATLEAIAQAIFKSWFIDFDPVHAKQQDIAPDGMDEATAALFPDSFEESELGLVPTGWKTQQLGELCTIQKGCSYKGAGLSEDEGAYMFNLGCFNAPRVFATEKIKRYTGEYRERHSVKEGDLIIANTDMTQERAILGRPLIVPNGFAPGFISHHVFKVEPKYDELHKMVIFLYFAFLQPTFRDRAVGYATGTTVLALPKDALELHRLLIPSAHLIKKFTDMADSIFLKIETNLQKIEAITSLRDTLLPRLISGKLRVYDDFQEIEDEK